MGHTHRRRLSYQLMGYQGTLYLSGTETVAGNIDNIVYSSQKPVVAILIYPGTITSVVYPGKLEEVGVFKPFWLAIDPPHQAGPGPLNRQIAALIDLGYRAILSENYRLHTGEW
ncbi:hypothetical protein ES705_35880 [subsurface metagenome]